MARQLICHHRGVRDYVATAREMQELTRTRDAATPDELWLLEHPPVFTQGQAGKAEHVLDPGPIPVVQANRGGQVTYHGPGQLVAYPLLDLRRLELGPRGLVTALEHALVALLAGYGIAAFSRDEAPGVYVARDFGRGEEVRKIGSIGLRVSRGCSYHGLSLNVAMDLSPFSRINPCGFAGLRMTQLSELGGPGEVSTVAGDLCTLLQHRFGPAQTR